MGSNIQERFIELFEEAQREVVNFKKKQYEVSFEAYYHRYRGLLLEVNQIIEENEDKDAALDKIAGIIPEFVLGKMDTMDQKRKKEQFVMDYNLALVSYVLPVINYGRLENSEALSNAIVQRWNSEVSKVPVKNSTYEAISAGFDQRLCYITTAVCQSLGKPDDCYELELLRNYRDEYLLGKEAGTQIVQEYYNVAPTIVKRINRRDDAKEVYNDIWKEYLTSCIQLIEEDKLEDCREVYTSMVQGLQKKYLYS